MVSASEFVWLKLCILFWMAGLFQAEDCDELLCLDELRENSVLLYDTWFPNQERDQSNRHRIYPNLNFTCDGMISEIAFLVHQNGIVNSNSLKGSILLWNKDGSVRDQFPVSEEITIGDCDNSTQTICIAYVPIMLAFEMGDSLGWFQANGSDFELVHQSGGGLSMYSNSTSVNASEGIGRMIHFDRQNTDGQLPLIAISERDNQNCSQGPFLSMEAMRTIPDVLNEDEREQIVPVLRRIQRRVGYLLFPGIRLRLGSIPSWTFAAFMDYSNPIQQSVQFQVWRSSCSDDGNHTYTLVGSNEIVNATSTGYLNVYQLDVPSEHQIIVEEDDVFGVYLPVGDTHFSLACRLEFDSDIEMIWLNKNNSKVNELIISDGQDLLKDFFPLISDMFTNRQTEIPRRSCTKSVPTSPDRNHMTAITLGVLFPLVVIILVVVFSVCFLKVRRKFTTPDNCYAASFPLMDTTSGEYETIPPPLPPTNTVHYNIPHSLAMSLNKSGLPDMKDLVGTLTAQDQVPDSLKIPAEHLKLSGVIGQGAFGCIVYEGILTDWNNTPVHRVAVKTLKALFTLTDVQSMFDEITKMKDFHHPHVISLIGVCLQPSVCMVSPFMANGNLLDYLRKHKGNLELTSEAESYQIVFAKKVLLKMCHQIALGMAYLAENKFVHRDLAARNCMLDSDGSIKVGEFGLAEDVYSTGYFRQEDIEEVKLPYRWMALESLDHLIFNEKTDVWSYGVTMWEVFSGGQIPYQPEMDPVSLVTLLRGGGRLETPNNAACSQQIAAVMASCWYKLPEERPDFSQLSVGMDQLLSIMSDYTKLIMENLVDSHGVDRDGYNYVLSPEEQVVQMIDVATTNTKDLGMMENTAYNLDGMSVTENTAYNLDGMSVTENTAYDLDGMSVTENTAYDLDGMSVTENTAYDLDGMSVTENTAYNLNRMSMTENAAHDLGERSVTESTAHDTGVMENPAHDTGVMENTAHNPGVTENADTGVMTGVMENTAHDLDEMRLVTENTSHERIH